MLRVLALIVVLASLVIARLGLNDDGEADAVEADGSPDHLGVALEDAGPEPVAEDRLRRRIPGAEGPRYWIS